jgi:hypothetical protein
VYAHNCVLIRIYNYYCYYIYTHSQRETWEETFDFGNGRYGVRVNLPFHQSIDSFFFHQWFISGCFSHRMEHVCLWSPVRRSNCTYLIPNRRLFPKMEVPQIIRCFIGFSIVNHSFVGTSILGTFWLSLKTGP